MNLLTDGIDQGILEKIGARVGKLFQNGKFTIGAFDVGVSIDNSNHRAN